MKMTYEAYGEIFTVETDYDDMTMEQLYPLIQQLLLGAGFGADTIKEYFSEDI